MKRNVKSILGIVFILFILQMMTGCDEILGEWDKPTPAVVEPTSSTSFNVTVSCAITGSDITFAAGDKLYITGTGIKGAIEIQSGAGTANATFSGSFHILEGELLQTILN